MHHHTDRIAHTIAFVTPVVEHWLEREIAQWVHHEGSIRRPIAPWADPLPRSLTKSQNSTWHRSVGQSLEHWVNVLLVVLFQWRLFRYLYYTVPWNHVSLYGSERQLRGKSVRSWCDGSSDRSFMGWTHWAISRFSLSSTTGVTKTVVYIILSVG